VNKVDNNARHIDANEFYSLGLGNYFALSSMNGSGTGDLLDNVVENLPAQDPEAVPELPRIAIVGRPNVGKSSLVNSLLGEERNIVTPLAARQGIPFSPGITSSSMIFYSSIPQG